MSGRAIDSSPMEALAGLVERVTFHNAENGFCVLWVKVRGQRDLLPSSSTLRRSRQETAMVRAIAQYKILPKIRWLFSIKLWPYMHGFLVVTQ